MKAQRKEYRICDAQNLLHAIHVRVEDANGRKCFEWYRPDGQPRLDGRSTASLPLYGSERVPNWKPGEPVVLVEGEKACDALLSHNFNALGTVTGCGGCPDLNVLEPLRERHVILWPDADERGRAHMRRIAERLRGVAARIVTFEWRDAPEKGDAADYLFTPEAATKLRDDLLRAQTCACASATPTEPAPLPRRRLQGKALMLKDVEPWQEPVEGADLLDEIASKLARYAVLPANAATAMSLWVAMTYLTDAVDVLPRLLITSPTRECGKSRVLTLLAALVRRPLASSSITPSALFRTIDDAKPTLILDEMDNARLTENADLRAMLNSGHTRPQAFTVRTVGEQHEPRHFSTWAAVALAGIGRVPDTIASRSIRVAMRRKRRDEVVSPFRETRVHAEFETLRRKLARWCEDHSEAVRAADPKVPDPLDGREADNWSPLLAIADAADRGWPERARRAACQLGGGVCDDDDVRVTLLGDLLDLFDACGDRIASDDLLAALRRMDARPWPEWRDGKPISARGIAALLKPFGIEPRDIRLADSRRLKGYERAWFEDLWPRYLSPYPRQARQPASEAARTHDPDLRHGDLVADEEQASDPHRHCVVADVADAAGSFGSIRPQPKFPHPVTSPLDEFLNTELSDAGGAR